MMGSSGWIIVGAACIVSSLIMWVQGRDNGGGRCKNLSA